MDYKNVLPQEDEHIEYKKSKKSFPKEAWKSISAFENTDGGILILGVDELDNHTFEISGVDDAQKIRDEFFSNNNDKDKISYSTIENSDYSEIRVKDKTIVEIRVRQAVDKQKPVFLNKNQAFIRKGATDARADKNELRRLYRLSDGNIDTQVLKNYWIDDLDMESINRYRSELAKRESYRYYTKFNDEEFLTKIGVISKDYDNDGKVGITIGGLLFFGNNNAIIHTFPNFQLEFYDKSNLDKERWTYRISSVDENLNIYTFFLKVENYLSNHLSNEFKLDRDGKRVDTFGSMFVALREATINMLMHADYFEDDHISLNSFSNYYEFYNPGKMKIQSDDFFTTNISITRNPIISKLFVQAGYGERAGHGGIKIFESSTKNNYRSPEIITDVDKTKLTIWKVDYADSFSNIQVDDRERAVIKAILKSDVPELSHKDIESLTGYSRFIADKAINSLLEKNIISKSGNARSTRYLILRTKNQLVATAQAIPDMLRNYFKH